MAYAKTRYKHNNFEANASLSFNKQWDKTYDGILAYPTSHYTYRNEEIANLMAEVNLSYKLNRYLRIPVSYGFKRSIADLWREDTTPNQGNSLTDRSLTRNAQDLKYMLHFTYDYIFSATVENVHYFSNTLSSSSYTNLFPGASFRLNINHLLDELCYIYIPSDQSLVLRGSIRKSIGESSLIYANPAALSTTMSSADFRSYYEYMDIFHNDELKAETYLKRSISLTYDYRYLNAEVAYFNHNTKNVISPVSDGTQDTYSLQNIGAVNNSGYYVHMRYAQYKRNSRKLSFEATLNFTQEWSKVTDVYNGYSAVPLAGFADVATVFAKNEPLGAIYGTTYLRDEQGRKIIGDDGFPLVDGQLKKIGDPTPDFTLSLNPIIRWRSLEFSFVLEYSHGGDRWNGTRAYLDYLGMSEGSANNRNITGYIFDGVTSSGEANTVPVDFYDPARPLSENRWVRYGATGVGEEYIEDATYLRLSNIGLAYTFELKKNGITFSEVKVGVKAQNLFLLTAYKGVDPASTLFGYSSGGGLDLFNQPSLRTYSFTLSIKL
jgi:hypothetical protein